jgi:hypothetical protein
MSSAQPSDPRRKLVRYVPNTFRNSLDWTNKYIYLGPIQPPYGESFSLVTEDGESGVLIVDPAKDADWVMV